MTKDTYESDGLKKIPASEILAKIEKGMDVEYDNVEIEGDLDISRLELSKQRIDRTNFERVLGIIR